MFSDPYRRLRWPNFVESENVVEAHVLEETQSRDLSPTQRRACALASSNSCMLFGQVSVV